MVWDVVYRVEGVSGGSETGGRRWDVSTPFGNPQPFIPSRQGTRVVTSGSVMHLAREVIP